MQPFRLGHFDAIRLLGRGGMGEVWLGVHRASGTEVAIKLVTAENLRGGVFEKAFEAEVRAVASLDHPGIIRLFDVGLVDADQAAQAGDRVVEGCPYLVMELADGGNLRTDPPPADWAAVRRVLLQILHALAHAHARGVVHRDIKPANVLWGPPVRGEGPPRVVLSDFGIAHAGEGGKRSGPTWGTPAYMAPERFTLEWRDLGPWTDLYSVGCLAFTLLRGSPPFTGSPLAQAMQAHLYRPVPSLRAPCPVPAGVDTWLRTLLAKSPEDRFQSAADAAWALEQLGEAAGGEVPLWSAPSSEDTVPTGRSGSTSRHGTAATPPPPPPPDNAEITWTDDTFDPAALSRATAMESTRGRGPRPRHSAPPMPATWRGPAEDAQDPALPGGGLRLFGLRVVRMVDREDERDRLWEALRRVRERNRPAAVLLRGRVGTGKTRLAAWLAERATETGAAVALRAEHGPGGGAPALARMVAAHLRVTGLGRRALRGRVQAWLQARDVRDEWFARELVAIAALGAGVELEPGESTRDLRATVQRFLAVVTQARPVVLHLDDIPFGATSLSFVAELLEQSPRLPVLLVLTAREEALDDNAVAATSFEELRRRGLLEQLRVEALPEAHRVPLVQQLLGVEETLARQVAERTAGNPLFTVALVRDWVARGLLQEHAEGLRLAPGTQLVLPDDLHAVWHGRLETLLAGVAPGARQALELAAALGESVDPAEWALACTLAGLELPPDLHERLVAERLVVADGGSWRFVHGMVRESLVRVAHEQGRWLACHAACAEVLLQLHATPDGIIHERIGQHLAEAGQPARALLHLEEGVQGRLAQGEPSSALMLLARIDRLLAALPPEQARGERVRAALLRARALVDLGKHDLAGTWARRAAQAAAEADLAAPDPAWRLLRARALLVHGNVATASGQLSDGRALLAEARKLLGLDAAFEDLGECQRLTGRLHRALGDLDQAEESMAEAAEFFGALQRDAEWADCLVALGEVAIDRGDAEHATGLLTSAIERYRAIRHRRGEADCLRVGAGAARLRGDLQAAEHRLRRAQAIYQRVGSTRTTECRLGRARLAMERGELDEAARLVRSVHGDEATRVDLRARAAALALAIAAAQDDWPGFDLAFQDLGRLLLQSGMRLHEVQELVAQAARDAAAHGQAGRAARVRGMLGR